MRETKEVTINGREYTIRQLGGVAKVGLTAYSMSMSEDLSRTMADDRMTDKLTNVIFPESIVSPKAAQDFDEYFSDVKFEDVSGLTIEIILFNIGDAEKKKEE